MKISFDIALKINERERKDLEFVLDTMHTNRSTYDDKNLNEQSIRSYKLVKELFNKLGIF